VLFELVASPRGPLVNVQNLKFGRNQEIFSKKFKRHLHIKATVEHFSPPHPALAQISSVLACKGGDEHFQSNRSVVIILFVLG